MQKHHDSGYKNLLSNKEIFRQLMTSFVREKWVKDLDFSKCELIKGSFVSRRYKKTFTDLLYKVKLRGRDLYVVILLEFKSAPALFVAVQMAGYILDFYRHLIDSEKRLRKLPPVFPIMLYNGKRRWTSPINLAELIEGQELLGEYVLHFKYYPVIENSFSRRALLEIGNIVSTLFLLEAHYDVKLLEHALLALFEKTKNKQALSLFFNFVLQLFLHERINESDYRVLERTYYDKKEVNMLIEAIRKEKAQIREKGKREGRQEGRQEGKKLKGLEIAKLMLANGEPISKIKLYTGLTEEVVIKLKKEIQI
jgi:predicted transposase/invertase (TIGR01784 family)